MCVPEDGVGVPLRSWIFNAMAYRGFVFLHRSSLLDEPPNFWFDGNAVSRKCFNHFQDSLRSLGGVGQAENPSSHGSVPIVITCAIQARMCNLYHL